jgi:plasmid stability protein
LLASFGVATLYVRNVPDEVLERLRANARAKRRSLNAEALEILEEAAADVSATPITNQIEEIAKRLNLGPDEFDPVQVVRELRDAEDPRSL